MQSKKITQILMLFFILINFGFESSVTAQKIKTVVDSPQIAGKEFTVDIRVENAEKLLGISFLLNYTHNTDYIDALSAEKGDFLGDDVVWLDPEIDDSQGTVSIGITRKRPADGVDGNGVIAKVTFESELTTPDDTSVDFTITDIEATTPDETGVSFTAESPTEITIRAGVPKAGALKLYLSPPCQTHYPPHIGDKITLDLMLDELNAGEYIYNLSFAIDYDADVVKIEKLGFSTDEPAGDIGHHFSDFATEPSKQNYNMNTTTSLNPPADQVFEGKNVERFIFGTSVNKVQDGVVGQDEFPFQRPAEGLSKSLMTITFTIQTDDPAKASDVLFVLDKTEVSNRDDELYTITKEDADISLPVELSMFTAICYPDGIEVIWDAKSQHGNLGWNLYRSESKDGEFEKINAKIIQGAGTTAISKMYKFIDKDARRGRSYFYYLETVSFNGEKDKSNIIEVSLVNTSLSWGAMKQLALYPRRSTPTLTATWTITIVKVYDREGKLLRVRRRLPNSATKRMRILK